MRFMRLGMALRVAVVALAALAGGCSKKTVDNTVPNLPPVVRLTQAPFNDGSAYFYAYRLNWLGYDPDGRVENYVYAIDPINHLNGQSPLVDGSPIAWQDTTTRNEQIIFFTAGKPDSSAPLSRAIDFHTFVIRAVDDDGDSSEVVTRSFFSFTTAPTVNIANPRPSSLVTANLTPSVRITWTGTDPDGQFTTKPVKYKYTLISAGSEFPLEVAISDPDSVRRFYAPEFAGWDSSPADTTDVQYTNLTPGADYVFVVVGIDEAGAYSPIFGLNNNMLRFRVGFAGQLGPKITMFNQFFFFQYASGGYSTDPQREVFLEVPAGQVVTFNWFADPPPGSDISSYRWALDIPDVSDNTPRDDEELDVTRWSAASLLTLSATVGPFGGAEEHRFYIEALDNNGLRSLGIVRFQVVEATLENPLAIVDDTRLFGDERPAGQTCVRLPQGEWPTAAELDTFLFAKGGVPWRCYPAGTMSSPGLFAPYEFDTIGTRNGNNEAVVRLAILGRYRHVVWVVDGRAANNNRPGSDPFNPITSLRYMSGPGRFNSLGAYVQQGGKVWLVGGGGAMATLIPWDNNNNNGSGITFSSTLGELIPGRFMYDLAAWRSEVKIVKAPLFVQRFLGRLASNGTYPPGDPGSPAPDFNRLPLNMRAKTPANDPIPPGREGQSPTVYYKSAYDAEFLSISNFVLEDLNPDPDLLNEQSVLDTLYRIVTFSLPPTTAQRVAMTYYHGPVGTPFVFTGFSIWDFTRADCQTLVDWVLQDVWGLTPNPVPAAARVPAPAPAQTVQPVRRAAPTGSTRGASAAPASRPGGAISSRE